MNVYHVTTFREEVPGHLRPINWGGGGGGGWLSIEEYASGDCMPCIHDKYLKNKNNNKNTHHRVSFCTAFTVETSFLVETRD